ncbi:conserved hypothetical protein [metagenome]|uniref:Purine nucleoside phosphorylase n=1 Tax=metagenome TaxID=256318 RepID=A0A2P2BWB2_9ZZZZ
MFAYRDTREGGVGSPGAVHVAFTDVQLDLAEAAPDREDALGRLEAAIEVPIARMHQVHGIRVADVTQPRQVEPEADSLVTAEPAVALLVRVADCVPVVLADPRAGLLAVAHAGRLGMAEGVVPRTVERLRSRGAVRLTAWVGPHICGRCYEVPEEMRADVSSRVPQSWSETRWGTPGLDLGAGVRAQLLAGGCEVVDVPGCTLEDTRLHSYRRDGAAAGRFGGLVWREA